LLWPLNLEQLMHLSFEPSNMNRYAVALTTANSVQFLPLGSILTPYQDEFAFAMEPDWNGRGAIRLEGKVLKLADRLLSKYATSMYLVEVAPSKKGSLSFVWEDGDGNYIYLDIGPNETLHLYYKLIDGRKWEGVSLASDQRIIDHLVRAFSFVRTQNVSAESIVFPGGTSNRRERLVSV